jgi:division protein CdvB (Snf7/Vps24/ESCRT-III family)
MNLYCITPGVVGIYVYRMKKFFKNFDLFGERGVADRAKQQDPNGAGQIFDKNATVKSQCREWNRNIRREIRKIERDVDGMTRSEKTTAAEIKKLAEKKEIGSVKILAKELVRLRRSRDRMLLTKTQLNSVSNQLTQQMAVAKLGSTFQQSTELMSMMNQLVNVPEITETMHQMSREMQNMGVIEAVMSDAMDEALGDTVETEEQTELEVNKLLEELAIDAITLMPMAGKDKLAAQRTTTGPQRTAAKVDTL